jgi:hypothetical protein
MGKTGLRRFIFVIALGALPLAGCTVEATGFAADPSGYHEGSVRASTAEAVIGPDGRCQSDVSIDPATLRGGPAGVRLGATECEVVAIMGGPYSVEIRRGPHGERRTRLTYVSGPRIGVYHFLDNRLTAIGH